MELSWETFSIKNMDKTKINIDYFVGFSFDSKYSVIRRMSYDIPSSAIKQTSQALITKHL